QTVGANGTLSKDTRMVAGRLIENTTEASRSAWDLLRKFSERKRAPVRKMRMKAMREGGMGRKSSRKVVAGAVGNPSSFAHTPSGAILPGFAGRKPSGIPAATVSRPWCLGQFQFSFPAKPRRILAPPGNVREPEGFPLK